jgi:hypothetical protein
MRITKSRLLEIIKEEMEDNLYSPSAASVSKLRTAIEDSGELEELIRTTSLPRLLQVLTSEVELERAEEARLRKVMKDIILELPDAELAALYDNLQVKEK